MVQVVGKAIPCEMMLRLETLKKELILDEEGKKPYQTRIPEDISK